MFQGIITLDQYAGIHPDMIIHGRADVGLLMSTTGTHPKLGAFVVLQDINPGLILISERPYSEALFPGPGESVGGNDEGVGYDPSQNIERASVTLGWTNWPFGS